MNKTPPTSEYTNGAAEEASEGQRRDDATVDIVEMEKTGFVTGRDSSRAGGEDGSNDGRFDNDKR